MLEYGKDLVKDRENVRGAPAVRSQLDIVVNRWEMLTNASNKRRNDLENALGQRFKECVHQITVWLKKKELEVQNFNQKRETVEFSKYIGVLLLYVSETKVFFVFILMLLIFFLFFQELLIEIQRYEYIFLTVHRSSKQLTEAGQTEKIQVYELLVELDDLWNNLSNTYQMSQHFSEKVRLRSLKDLESDIKMEDEVMEYLLLIL